ncbi:MAG: hypothetical protein EA425_02190 [Puniceicoccaceae bacterium]|nr:MAG: hypothetical protein EA425_02190 [Puniceicoccaceae bacterium]
MKTLLLAAALVLLAACVAPMPSPPTADHRPTEVSIQLETPSAGWEVRLERIYILDAEILAVSRLHPPDGPAATVISTVEDRVVLPLPDWPVRHAVLGKTWAWTPEGGHWFPAGEAEIEDRTGGEAPVWTQPAPP